MIIVFKFNQWLSAVFICLFVHKQVSKNRTIIFFSNYLFLLIFGKQENGIFNFQKYFFNLSIFAINNITYFLLRQIQWKFWKNSFIKKIPVLSFYLAIHSLNVVMNLNYGFQLIWKVEFKNFCNLTAIWEISHYVFFWFWQINLVNPFVQIFKDHII